eukprot:823852-Amphidinium_carterae.1
MAINLEGEPRWRSNRGSVAMLRQLTIETSIYNEAGRCFVGSGGRLCTVHLKVKLTTHTKDARSQLKHCGETTLTREYSDLKSLPVGSEADGSWRRPFMRDCTTGTLAYTCMCWRMLDGQS